MVAVRSPIRVVGRYAIYNEIAAGGMAAIHLGRLLGPVGFARTVAVKRLHPQYAKDPEFVSMFLDEARLAARVQHPNVVATIDVVATDGELFLIMDYVRGESLSKVLRSLRRDGKRVPPRIATAIICGFLHGLHAAHEAKNERGEALGLVHRDVSPQNVLVGADGIPRVLDFGIAKAAGRIQVTRDGQIKGKLAYMPPEQLAGREISRAVDIYASAVVTWETLTTERLFKGETDGATLAKILRDKVPPPSSVHPDLAPFDAAVMRALSRDTTKRHNTAKELALELERCIGIASPTEVGEWVEGIVGPILSAREDQIAEIESSSAALRLPARPGSPETLESDERKPLPSTRTILAAIGKESDQTAPPESAPRSSRSSGPNGTSVTERMVPGADDATGTSRAGWLTGSMFALPVDRKLPMIATFGGMLVLLVALAIVVGGRFSSPVKGDRQPRAETSAITSGSSAIVGGPLVTDPPPPLSASPVPDPAPPADPTAASADSPSGSAEPKPRVPDHAATPRPFVPKSNAPTPPTATGTRQPAKNCDPPYFIDAQGRHKYKRECM